jgi:ankyrin repeat protein
MVRAFDRRKDFPNPLAQKPPELTASQLTTLIHKDDNGRTPLSWAAGKGHEAIAKLLLETGKVDVDSKSEDGWTPLSWAAESGYEAIAKLLQSSCQRNSPQTSTPPNHLLFHLLHILLSGLLEHSFTT